MGSGKRTVNSDKTRTSAPTRLPENTPPRESCDRQKNTSWLQACSLYVSGSAHVGALYRKAFLDVIQNRKQLSTQLGQKGIGKRAKFFSQSTIVYRFDLVDQNVRCPAQTRASFRQGNSQRVFKSSGLNCQRANDRRWVIAVQSVGPETAL